MPSYRFHLINPFFLDGIVHQEILANRILDDIIIKLNPFFSGIKKFKDLKPGYYGIMFSGNNIMIDAFKRFINGPVIQKNFTDIKMWWKTIFLIQEKQQQRLRRQRAISPMPPLPPGASYLQSWKRLPQQGKSDMDKSIW
jgi:hypothetical protein